MTDVGVLGGTFDPFHNGHMQLAEAVLNEYRLDNIIFVPAGNPPHKSNTSITEAKHRLQMLRLAVHGKNRYRVSEIEFSSVGPSYTFSTLQRLQEHSGDDVVLHFIIGHDAFLELETWYRWETLLAGTPFIIAQRPGYAIDGLEAFLSRNNFRPETPDKRSWKEMTTGNIIRVLSKKILDISSTKIRERIARKQEWRHFVPESVAGYILDNDIYC